MLFLIAKVLDNKGNIMYITPMVEKNYFAIMPAFILALSAVCIGGQAQASQASESERDRIMQQALEAANTPAGREATVTAAQETRKDTNPSPGPSAEQETAPAVDRGAWTLPKGKLYTEIYNKYYWHNSQFDNSGDKTEWNYNGHYDEIRSELKLEYGVTDELTVLAYLPYKEIHWRDDYGKYTNKGLADVWTGGKYRILTDPFIFSLQARIKIPTNYNENDTPSIGRRQIDGDIKLLFAKPLQPYFNGYAKFETGFRGRAQEPTNEIPYFYELGYNLTKSFVLKATIDGVEGLHGTGKAEEDYTKGTISTIYKFYNYGIELGYGNTFRGKNTSAAEEIILSLSALF